MKKTLLVTLEFPPDVGGVARYLTNVVSHLPSGKVVVLAPKRSDQGSLNTEGRFVLYRRRLLSGRWVWPRWLPLVFHTLRIAKREGAEQLMVSHVLPAGTVCWILRRWFPYTVILHGMDITTPHTWWKRFLIRFVLRSARTVIVNSEFTKRKVAAYHIPQEKLQVVYPGVDIIEKRVTREDQERKKSALEERYNLRGAFMLLTVARLVKRKGILTVLEALPELRKKIPSLVYFIVGTGPEEQRLRNYVQKQGLETSVRFTGFVPDADLPTYFERCDAFIMVPQELPDRDVEGFGIVYLEANAFSRPVIGTRTGGVSEAIRDGETGLLIPPADPNAVVDAVWRLFHDETFAKRLGQQGKTRVLNTFNWSTQTAVLAGLL